MLESSADASNAWLNPLPNQPFQVRRKVALLCVVCRCIAKMLCAGGEERGFEESRYGLL